MSDPQHDSKHLISTERLAEKIGAPTIKVVDASWRMPGPGGTHAKNDFIKRHIPGAVFFDLDTIADNNSNLPHMIPSTEQFNNAIGAMGISKKDHVVVYDDVGLFSAARVWWTFIVMGHARVSVLDGGLPKWTSEDRETTNESHRPLNTSYRADPVERAIVTSENVRSALERGHHVLDARPAARFKGDAPEPRAGLRLGHMPGAKNLPFKSLLRPDQTLKPIWQLKALFAEMGITDPDTPIVTTCGSGVTAAIINLALAVAGMPIGGLYDGSWAEWGNVDNDPARYRVITG